MPLTQKELISHAHSTTGTIRKIAESREGWNLMGCVGAALVTENNTLYTGVNIHLLCGMGICAEYSAVAEMIKNGETVIRQIAAVTSEGNVLPPCGKCREMLFQIDKQNLQTEVTINDMETKLLHELLPLNWQNYFDKPL